MKLFCLTYAGGTAAFFDELSAALQDDLEVVSLEYPGHGKRHREPYAESFATLAEEFYGVVRDRLSPGERYALLGYSMGTIVLAEVLSRILERGELKAPVRVFLGAHEPRSRLDLAKCSEQELDDYIRMLTISFGGIPDVLLSNRSFWRTYLPLYRADYLLIGHYDFASLRLHTDTPATILYSPSDTPLVLMQLWKDYFTGDCEFVAYDGNHFFLKAHIDEISSLIACRLSEID